jgi:ribonuclease J
MTDRKLQLIPLGGLGEFGMHSLAIRLGDDIIVIDAGMMFPEAELLGVDIVTPDFAYLEQNREHVRGLILTHGHEDHIGAVPFLLAEVNIPVYGTAFTLELVGRRLDEHDLRDQVTLNVIKPSSPFQIGPFRVEFIHVTHSIVNAVALAITTELGVIIHTGDFKVDPTPTDNELFDLHTLADYGRRGVLLLLSDSTNVERPGFTESERAVRPRLEEAFSHAEGRLVVSCFSSSIHRLQQIVDLSAEYGRKVAFLGRSVLQVTEIAHNLGLLDLPDGILLRAQDIMQVPRKRVTVVASGTQGEPMSAMSRVAVDSHRHLSLAPGDTVLLSSRVIPGNEKAIFRMVDHVCRRGADVWYGTMNPPLHVSGHASIEELKLVLNLVRPRYFVPVHGEYRQLMKHAMLARHMTSTWLDEAFVLETGQTLEFDERGARRGENVPVGRLCIDSGTLDDVVEDLVIRDRRHLSEEGFIVPVIAISKLTGRSEGLPEIVSRGFVSSDDGAEILNRAKEVVARTLRESTAEERTDWGLMQEKIRVDLKRFINREASRRPLILPVILEV